MKERINPDSHGSQTGEVKGYYGGAKEYGPGRFLDGMCHFGFTPEGDESVFDLKTAQLEMEDLLGRSLGLPEGSVVLDSGTGWGPVARRLHTEFGLKVHGIDLMRERLEGAREMNIESGVEIGLGEADYHNLPFSDGSFDGVFTMETLVHADSLEKVLNEFGRVLKPGGKLVLFEYSVPGAIFRIPGVSNLANKVIKRTAMASLPRFTHGAFPDLLDKAGFEDISVEDIGKNVWPTWKHLWKDALINTAEEIKDGDFNLDNIQGSIMIYPGRHWLRHNVIVATKARE